MVWSVLRTMYLEERLAQAQQIGSRRGMGTFGWKHLIGLWIPYPMEEYS